jgi:hypothetical protein
MYEVACWQGLAIRFQLREGAIRYAIELQDSGVRRVSVWNLDTGQPVTREFLEARADLIRQLCALEHGAHRLPAMAVELTRRIAELDTILSQA